MVDAFGCSGHFYRRRYFGAVIAVKIGKNGKRFCAKAAQAQRHQDGRIANGSQPSIGACGFGQMAKRRRTSGTRFGGRIGGRSNFPTDPIDHSAPQPRLPYIPRDRVHLLCRYNLRTPNPFSSISHHLIAFSPAARKAIWWTTFSFFFFAFSFFTFFHDRSSFSTLVCAALASSAVSHSYAPISFTQLANPLWPKRHEYSVNRLCG